MSTQEKMLEKLRTDLQTKVEAYFESIERFGGQYILNSKVTTASAFEKNKFCSEFVVYNLNQLPVAEIMLGNANEISVLADIRVATSSNIPKCGKDLNTWSSSIFGITIDAEVTFNPESKEIEVSRIEVRSR